MSYQNFNRHEIFSSEDMTNHKDLIDQVELFKLEKGDMIYSTLTNYLYGIWDGFLYNDLMTQAEKEGMPKSIIFRIGQLIMDIKSKL